MQGITVMDHDTSVWLHGWGFEHCVVSVGEDASYAIETEWDGEVVERLLINDIFHFSLIAEKLLSYHTREIERGNCDVVGVVVRDENNGIVWQNTTEGG